MQILNYFASIGVKKKKKKKIHNIFRTYEKFV